MPIPPFPGKGHGQLTSRVGGKRVVHGGVPTLEELADLQERVPDPDDLVEHAPDIDDPEIPEDERPGLASTLTTLEQEEFAGVIAELWSRDCEALKLYEPMPEQERFHASHAGERIIRGGNRGGKTLAACVELARAITGQDPHRKFTETNGRAIVVGKDLLHCSKVIYRKLFIPGAFRVIEDPETGRLRAFRPGVQWDDEHEHLAREAPPLIPNRFYKPSSMSWDNKREEILKSVKFSTGWELTFFSSLSPPPQGWDADLAYFDEEIEHRKWYLEVSARLLDRRVFNRELGFVQNGKFWWSATPQAGTQQLYELSSRAAECRDEENPRIQEFFCNLIGNIHVSEDSKKDFIAKLEGNEDEYRIRVLGDFAILGMRVYPEFSPKGVHGVQAFPIPDDWTRWCAVDPGRQVCAVLFCVIPPPRSEYAGRKILYDELYIKRCSAATFAARMREKIGDTPVYAAIIDHHAGRITEIGSGKTHEEQYSAALKKEGVQFERGGSMFIWGSDDVNAGLEAVRRGLHIVDGISEWLVFRDKCPMLLWEADRYSYKKVVGTGIVTDVPLKRDDHLMDCWRYLAMANLRYVRPKQRKRKRGYAFEALQRKRERAKQKDPSQGRIVLG